MKKLYSIVFLIAFALTFCQQGPKVGLVLSGGGAKGYAHIGVLKVLEKSGIRIDYISGTSMGAMVGGLYASGYSAAELDDILQKTDFNSLLFNEKQRKNTPLFDKTYREKYILEVPFSNFNFKIPSAVSKGQGSLDMLSNLLSNVHGISDYSKLPIPFLCVATDLNTGKEKVFEHGFLPESMLASSALPGLIEPFLIDGQKYIDGGLVNNMPSKLLKEKGMDIIIAVDLGQGLSDSKEIDDIAELFTQISNFTIIKGVEAQKPYCDYIINPFLNQMKVTDFDSKDLAVESGKYEAEKFMTIFTKIAELQGFTSKKQERSSAFTFPITQLKITGNDRYNTSYIKGKLNLKTPKTVTLKDVNESVNRLYSTGIYENITHKLIKVDSTHNDYVLQIELKEKQNNFFARIGLHYDDVYKTGLMVNLTHKRFIFNNSTASADIVFGDNPRYYLNFFSDNGIKPSVGFNSTYQGLQIKKYSEDSEISYKTDWFQQQFYLQSTLKEKYALGVGLQHDYIYSVTDFLPESNPMKQLENSYYISAYSYIKIDTRNNAYFPKKGLKLDASAKYSFSSNQANFLKNLSFSTSFDTYIRIRQKFSLHNSLSFGFGTNNTSFFQKTLLGGDFEQQFIQSKKTYGLKFSQAYADVYVKLYSGIQYEFIKNNYITAFSDLLTYVDNDYEETDLVTGDHIGLGLCYGYDSPFGPIFLRYTYATSIKTNVFSVGLGYWF